MDLTRYLPGYTLIDSGGRLALWCTDCGDPTNPLPQAPFWTEDEAAEQVTELCLGNLVAIAEEHEREHHADETAPPDPHAPHHVTVTAPVGKDEYFAAAEDWNTTLYSHGDRTNAYRIQHPADCDRLPYGQRCELDRYADDNAPSEMENWPTEPGEYTTRYMVHQPTNEQGEPLDVQEYIRFEPAPATEEATDAADA